MKVVGKNLDYHFHQVLLGNNVLAIDDLFQNAREDRLLIHGQIDTFELAEANEIGAHENTKLAPLHLALFAITRVPLVLQSYPELVHFDKVGKNECDGILQIPRWPLEQMVLVRVCKANGGKKHTLDRHRQEDDREFVH